MRDESFRPAIEHGQPIYGRRELAGLFAVACAEASASVAARNLAVQAAQEVAQKAELAARALPLAEYPARVVEEFVTTPEVSRRAVMAPLIGSALFVQGPRAVRAAYKAIFSGLLHS